MCTFVRALVCDPIYLCTCLALSKHAHEKAQCGPTYILAKFLVQVLCGSRLTAKIKYIDLEIEDQKIIDRYKLNTNY